MSSTKKEMQKNKKKRSLSAEPEEIKQVWQTKWSTETVKKEVHKENYDWLVDQALVEAKNKNKEPFDVCERDLNVKSTGEAHRLVSYPKSNRQSIGDVRIIVAIDYSNSILWVVKFFNQDKNAYKTYKGATKPLIYVE